jgi:methyltransferase
MVISRAVYLALLAGLSTERLFELWLSKRNAQHVLARGGIEVGRGHYRIMVAFHTAFIIACAVEATFCNRTFPEFLSLLALIGAGAAQALRYWSVVALGERWNTRVIVVPGTPPVTSGPYRYTRHPNYLAVLLEIVCVPLIRGLIITAAAFSAVNTILLAGRIRLEEHALGDSYQRAFAERNRFIPGISVKRMTAKLDGNAEP